MVGPAGTVGYCCLGVLCDVLDKQFPDVLRTYGTEVQVKRTSMVLLSQEYASADVSLNVPLTEWAFGNQIVLNGLSERQTFQNRLIEMNDDEGKGFGAIADFIEESLRVDPDVEPEPQF